MALRPINTFTVFVNPRYSESERKQLGIAIINFIVDRTKKGRGIGGQPFKNSQGQSKYSENYQNTKDFEIGGKSKSPINLTLSGDMLSSIEVLDTSLIGRIVIGYTDDAESDKSVFMEEKGYRFLGVSSEELNKIVSKFGKPSQSISPANISASFVESFVRGIIGR